jgi:hypothetical protein
MVYKKPSSKAKAANEDLDLGHEDNEPHMIKANYTVLENTLWSFTKW